ncbi:MAG: GntR family transcriptional regulator [Trueperaceae bacterium]|nr:GntR family transcriptional regulator [Trueperaceae bacterium]
MSQRNGGQSGKKKNLTEHIVEVLTDRIIRGQYAPNSFLREIEIADELGVSRSPLREALRVLSEQGLVEIKAGRGASVTPMTVRAASEFYDIRAQLESYCTQLSVEACTDEQIERLMDAFDSLQRVDQEGNLRLFQDQNTQFHMMLYSFCPNQTLVALVETFWRRGARYSRLLRFDGNRSKRILQRKRELIQFIWSRDAVGAAGCVKHIILSGKTDVMAAIAAGDPFSYWERARSRQRTAEPV